MIFIGLSDNEKRERIEQFRAENDIQKTVVISADEFPLLIPGTDQIKYSDVIMYVTYYRLLQEIDRRTLIVINECLRTQNRYDLAYNCIRNYLNQTSHQLIFQWIPQIDTCEDFMILFDFDTRSRWKRRPFDPFLIQQESKVMVQPLSILFKSEDVPTSEKTRTKYNQEREKMFRELGNRDPHIIPRNLYLLSGPDKLIHINSIDMPLFSESNQLYVSRNKRLNSDRIVTYEDVQAGGRYGIVELPHRFIDYCDFIRVTGQVESNVLVADLKVDHWYFNRYNEWSRRIHDTYASLSA
jgi:hypothetical protein